MGWDCSFHLVDPKVVSKNISSLVRGKKVSPQFLTAYPEEGKNLWDEARKRILTDEPEVAAHLACQIALHISASLWPHHREQGVALSFGYDPQPPRRSGVLIPEQLTSTPEVMFKSLLKKRPDLSGHFHVVFETNADTGIFIPAKNVSKAADYVRRHMIQCDEAEKARFEGLLRVLHAAARHGFAFWEATGISVAQTNPELLESAYERFEWISPENSKSKRYYPWISVEDDLVRFGWSDERFCVDTHIENIEFQQSTINGEMVSARLPDSRWLLFENNTLKLCKTNSKGIPTEVIGTFRTDLPASDPIVRISKGGAVLVPRGFSTFRAKSYFYDLRKPHFWNGDSLVPIQGFPDPKQGSKKGGAYQNCAMGAVTLADGKAVVIWNGDGYEVEDGKIVGEPWPLNIRELKWASRSYIPWGNDGFYYCSNKALRRIRRGRKPEPVAKLSDVVRCLVPGPEGSILASHVSDLKNLKCTRAATLFFPDEGCEIAFDHSDVKGPPSRVTLFYSGGYFWGNRDGRLFRVERDVMLRNPKIKSRMPKH